MGSRLLLMAALATTAIALAACGSPAAAAPAASAFPVATPAQAQSATPSATPAPSDPPAATPAPEPPPPAPAPPAEFTVVLSGLPAGAHPLHLHAVCNGGQGFHIATLGTLGGGTSSVQLPSGDFGRGWCLVVYTDPSLSRVLEYRPI